MAYDPDAMAKRAPSCVAIMTVLCAVSAAHADQPPVQPEPAELPPDEPVSPQPPVGPGPATPPPTDSSPVARSGWAWTATATLGAGSIRVFSASGATVGSFDLAAGAFMTPHVAIGGRFASAFVVDGPSMAGTLGPDIVVSLTDQLWVSGGGGLAFLAGSGLALKGVGLDARVGVTFLQNDVSPTVSAGFTAIALSGADGESQNPAFLVVSVMAGVQLRAESASRSGSSIPLDRRNIGTTLVVAGALSEVTALIVGSHALDLRDQARRSGCNDDLSGCNDSALPIAESAYHYSNVATAFFVAGLAGLGAGIYLRLTAPHAVTVSPSLGPANAGAAVSGSF